MQKYNYENPKPTETDPKSTSNRLQTDPNRPDHGAGRARAALELLQSGLAKNKMTVCGPALWPPHLGSSRQFTLSIWSDRQVLCWVSELHWSTLGPKFQNGSKMGNRHCQLKKKL